MASYPNTSEYYCGVTMDTNLGNGLHPSVYLNQNPRIYQTHVVANPSENFQSQKIYPRPPPAYATAQRKIIYHNNNLSQNPPFTPEPESYPMVCYQEPRPCHINKYMTNIHHAQIRILPSSHGSFEAIIKRKRKRTMFTTEQVQALEDIFKTKQYISREERQVIVSNLQLQDKAVKLWFQNRRLKTKRMQDQDSEDQEVCSSEKTARLDALESQIIKKTDAYGFVTLDDELMKDLVNTINEYLSVDVPVEIPMY